MTNLYVAREPSENLPRKYIIANIVPLENGEMDITRPKPVKGIRNVIKYLWSGLMNQDYGKNNECVEIHIDTETVSEVNRTNISQFFNGKTFNNGREDITTKVIFDK